MFLYGVGLSDCKSNGVAVYGNDNLQKIAHAFLKMLKLYLLWSLVYLPLAILDYKHSGFGVMEAAINYIKGLVFVGDIMAHGYCGICYPQYMRLG